MRFHTAACSRRRGKNIRIADSAGRELLEQCWNVIAGEMPKKKGLEGNKLKLERETIVWSLEGEKGVLERFCQKDDQASGKTGGRSSLRQNAMELTPLCSAQHA